MADLEILRAFYKLRVIEGSALAYGLNFTSLLREKFRMGVIE
jgi:hypothetical protein